MFYVVDQGQYLHFKQIFEIAKLASLLSNCKKCIHINFGIIKGDDGKRLRTRNGNTPQLIELLNNAVNETIIFYKKIILILI